jgi:dTDP-4-amino-4,6-dideoxygalactose transaminase
MTGHHMQRRAPREVIPHSRPAIDDSDFDAVRKRLASHLVAEGTEVSAFEQEIAAFVGAAGAVTAASGTQALVLALRTIGVTGRLVAMPTFTCRALVDATVIAGGKPLLIDIDDHLRLNREHLAKEVQRHASRIAAIIVVHNLGFADDIADLKEYGVPVVEDCCTAFGGRHAGALLGTMGVAGVVSFHATKLLTTAEGGAVISADREILQRIRETKMGTIGTVPFTPRFLSPLSDLQAALGRAQLSRYRALLARRASIASVYRQELSDLYRFRARNTGVVFREPMEHPEALKHAEALQSHGIMAKRPVTPLLHRLLDDPGEFPVADRLHDRLISLPLYPALSDDDVGYIVDVVRQLAN